MMHAKFLDRWRAKEVPAKSRIAPAAGLFGERSGWRHHAGEIPALDEFEARFIAATIGDKGKTR